MRKWFLSSAGAASLTLALAGGLPATGCTDITAGQLGEDPAAPKLMKVLVQDERPAGGRGIGTDLLDTVDVYPPAKCTVCPSDSAGRAAHPGCKENPCVASALGYPDKGCVIAMMGDVDGLCADPLSGSCEGPNGQAYDSCTAATGARPVYIGTPVAQGGNTIRLVFNKLLDPSIETVTLDPATGKNNYQLAAGILELDGPDGKEVMVDKMGSEGTPPGYYWDPNGSPRETSDPINIPFGPALVIKPQGPLSPSAKYTIKVDSSRLFDHKMQPATDAKGTKLPNPYLISFTVEDLKVLATGAGAAGAATQDVTTGSAVLAVNDAIQLQLNSGVDETTAKATLTSHGGQACKITGDCYHGQTCTAMACAGDATVPIDVFSDRGTDPMKCMDNLADRNLDIVPVDKPGEMAAAVDLAPGKYTVEFTALKDDVLGMNSPFTAKYDFTVVACSIKGMDGKYGPPDPTLMLADSMMTPACNPAAPAESNSAVDTMASANFLFPEQSAAAGHCLTPAADAGVGPDMSTPPPPADMAVPKADMATKPSDGGTKG